MPVEIGRIEALYRYPVKSMRGEALDAAAVGWHGIEGDRRLALRRVDNNGGFPWLTASKLPELIRFAPCRRGEAADGALPTHVVTPEGEELEVFGDALAAEIGRRHGAPVQMMRLDRGIFDDASISVITSGTVGEIGRLAATPGDARRFRPNIVIRSDGAAPFAEDAWLGGVLAFGDTADGPAVAVTTRDLRCVMVNLDPDDANPQPEVLKAAARANQTCAGIYATVTRVGSLAVGQPVLLHR